MIDQDPNLPDGCTQQEIDDSFPPASIWPTNIGKREYGKRLTKAQVAKLRKEGKL